jgi:flagellar assembly protein FliH
MAKLQKFLFDLDFDAPYPAPQFVVAEPPEGELLPEPIEELPPPPPSFSEEELALARDQAFQAGRTIGRDEAEKASERLTGQALAHLAQQFQELITDQLARHEQLVKDAVTVAVTVARKLIPEFIRRNGSDEIEAVVLECLSHLDRDVRVTIRVHPDLLDTIRDGAQRSADTVGFEGKLVFHGDARLGPRDCRVEWGDGGAERNEARIWSEMEAILARAIAAPTEQVGPAEESLSLSAS